MLQDHPAPSLDPQPVADAALIAAWLAARSRVRGLPAPQPDHGGLRVDTGSTDELRRYVFAAPNEGLRRLAETVAEPRVFLKACIPSEALRMQLPDRWAILSPRYVMTCFGEMIGERRAWPTDYRVELVQDGPIARARITTHAGEPAARGRAVEHAGVFIYDQIETEPSHQRRGLGRLVMTTLETARRDRASPQVLVATEDGRALYASLGWSVHAPYATATIPPSNAP